MLLALRPGLDAMLLGSCQVRADLLVCVEQEILHAARNTVSCGLACLCLLTRKPCMLRRMGEGQVATSMLHLHQHWTAGTCSCGEVTLQMAISGNHDWTTCDDKACESEKKQRVRHKHLNSLHRGRSWESPRPQVDVLSQHEKFDTSLVSTETKHVCVRVHVCDMII